MIRVIFKNLDSSELAKEAVYNRLDHVIEKFQNLRDSRINVTLEMENSPTHPGPDHFSVKTQVDGGLYDGVRITKSAPNLYVALADMSDHLLESLNRYSDKIRVKNRSRLRKLGRLKE